MDHAAFLRVPRYRHHKPSGQAVVTLNGRDIYLGTWNTIASRREYDRLTGEWLAAVLEVPGQPHHIDNCCGIDHEIIGPGTSTRLEREHLESAKADGHGLRGIDPNPLVLSRASAIEFLETENAKEARISQLAGSVVWQPHSSSFAFC